MFLTIPQELRGRDIYTTVALEPPHHVLQRSGCHRCLRCAAQQPRSRVLRNARSSSHRQLLSETIFYETSHRATVAARRPAICDPCHTFRHPPIPHPYPRGTMIALPTFPKPRATLVAMTTVSLRFHQQGGMTLQLQDSATNAVERASDCFNDRRIYWTNTTIALRPTPDRQG